MSENSGNGQDGRDATPFLDQWAPFTEAVYKAVTEVIAGAAQVPERYVRFGSTEIGRPNVFKRQWSTPQLESTSTEGASPVERANYNTAREALNAAADDIDTTLDSLRGDLVDLTVQALWRLGHPQRVEPHTPFGVDYATDLVNFLKTTDERIRAFHRELMEQAPDWSKYDTRQLTEAAPKKVKSDHPLAEGNWDHWRE